MYNLLLIKSLKSHSVKWGFEDSLFLIGISIIFIGILYLSRKKVPKPPSSSGETTKEEKSRRIQDEGVERQISAIYGTLEVNQKLSWEMLHDQKMEFQESEARKQQIRTTEESFKKSEDSEISENPEVFAFLTDITTEEESMMIMNPHYLEEILSEVEEVEEDNTGDEGDSSSSVAAEFPLPTTLEQKRSTRFRNMSNMQGDIKGVISKVHEDRRETMLSGSHGGIF